MNVMFAMKYKGKLYGWKERYACPLVDIVYKTRWIKESCYVRIFLDWPIETKVQFKLRKYTLAI